MIYREHYIKQIREFYDSDLIKILGLEDGDKFVLNSGWQDDEVGYTNSLLVEAM